MTCFFTFFCLLLAIFIGAPSGHTGYIGSGPCTNCALTDAANIFTATQTVNPANDTAALVSSGSSVTGSNAGSMIDLARTWNTTGAPTAIKLAITDTASNASSNLMELLAGAGGATSMFKVRKDGQVTTAGPVLVPDGTQSAPAFASASTPSSGISFPASTALDVHISGSRNWRFAATSVKLSSGFTISWTNGDGASNADLFVGRDLSAALQLGSDSASPIAQTLKAHDGSGTDKAGGDLTLASGNCTGAGAAGVCSKLILATTNIGTTGSSQNTSTARLHVPQDGGLQWLTATRPTCDAAHRGAVFYVAGGVGVVDTYEICRKDSGDSYAWTTLM